MNDSYIKLEIEPIVKLWCLCTNCKHNLYLLGEMACNLKHVEISEDARCNQYESTKVPVEPMKS